MEQLYFLSILCNGLGGYILFFGSDDRAERNLPAFLNNSTFYLALGVLSAVTGFLKFLSPSVGGGVPILGDLVPAVLGVISGFILIFGVSRGNKPADSDLITETSPDVLATRLLKFRKPLGLGLLASALIHFLFPRALFF